MINLADIRIFPVKSLRGGQQATAWVEPWGLAGDRRWMIVDGAGRFLTQREWPRMALIRAHYDGAGLLLETDGRAPLGVDIPAGGARRDVVIWRDTITAADAGDAAALWLGEVLGTVCRLVFLADPRARRLNPTYAVGDDVVSLADGFPLLLASAPSLADLNARLAAPIPMLRFRPNLVVSGAAAWAEDAWRRIRIGVVVFRVAKPCDRCVITTIDPETGARPDPVEPIRTLGTFRRDRRGGVMFGQNLVPEGSGEVRVGDAIEVLETGLANVQLERVGA